MSETQTETKSADSRETAGPLQQFCSQVWWLVLLRGIALIALGILLLTQPGITAILLVQFLGAYFLVDGIFLAVNSVTGRRYMQGWGWGLLMGVLEILTGIVIFANPLISTIITAGALVYMVAFLAIVFGLIGIVSWFQVRKEIQGEWALLAGGVLSVIFGFILLLNPEASVVAYLIVMGISAIVGGLVQIFASFQIRKIGKHGIGAVAG
jgi:uncharacterized membrane protein HdeD (DUF308 family)